MRKHHTNQSSKQKMLYVLDDDTMYAIPKTIAKKYIVETNHAISTEGNISADEIFAELDQKSGKAAALLKGLRARENLTQVEFAKKIGVSQNNLSKMENGKRPIGKTIAKRIANKFDVSYKIFLE